MQKGLQTRFIIHEILFLIKYKKYSLEKTILKKFTENSIDHKDKKLINTVVLNSLRFQHYINKIIKLYVKKNVNKNQYILLLSSITQLIYLDFKEYAVINCSVEIAKNKKINAVPGFINAVLRKILINKDKLKKLNLYKNDIPQWLSKEIDFLDEKKTHEFLYSITKEPNTHCVFKKEISNSKLLKENILTTKKSFILNKEQDIQSVDGYKEGDFWVQDYSAMLPLHLIKDLKKKDVLDMCSAPGGKAFQLISMGASVDIIEIEKKRAKILSQNLRRLKFKNKIVVENALNLQIDKKYDLIVIDAPCSSIGTLRRNPDILLRKDNILDKYIKIQKELLNKATKLLNKNGSIIYMVCSFTREETFMQVENFLKQNNNFLVKKFTENKESEGLIDKNGYINTLPKSFKNIYIDGFFAVNLIKND